MKITKTNGSRFQGGNCHSLGGQQLAKPQLKTENSDPSPKPKPKTKPKLQLQLRIPIRIRNRIQLRPQLSGSLALT